ncbi:hypothetical protein [Streptomyces sp. NPDC059063]|uniref:hypothetical protein n=1 Tax=unclassified Streptomyces TaxID=2593676 RepID=UPI003690F3C0
MRVEAGARVPGLSETVVELGEEERAELVGEVSDRRVVWGCCLVVGVLCLAVVLYGALRG